MCCLFIIVTEREPSSGCKSTRKANTSQIKTPMMIGTNDEMRMYAK